ncbi:MAG: hypothetical protein WCP52_06280 [Bacteroidota bacterium]
MEAFLCPYPGLRPFEEKESIFFKGRDTHVDEIIQQIEQKRFVMITGASGDGKSSIIYAGVIPNVKAGFIKANYNAWRFSIIKPEDKPLYNLSASLAEVLNLSTDKVYEDLSYGFSSIIELYKRSDYYIDNQSKDWQDLSLDDKKARRAKASNLFILVDQFEEFFTNTENFYNGEPTAEAEIAINLLTETVRVANEQKLPIYIVFTMRSDFIGNSSAFRGLPELVGFSHFFIPRLKREEIEKIVLEPALLNGDTISEQLVNYLTSAAADGADQLPIIQHALNRIWNIARENNEEMDLIHLAMAGGLDPLELPDKDRKRFNIFFDKLPSNKKQHYSHPSLQNVINAHADELLEDTVTEFKSTTNGTVDEKTIRFALKRGFQTLTKIDEGRSVRHRTSVKDLIGNINIASIGLREVNNLLDKFREEGNTLINPFVSQTEKLKEDSVIDITHEALIRNWKKLSEWVEEDDQNLNNYTDFNKQLIRWEENNKSSRFLLSLGPLEQFENWYKHSLINEYWIVKYDESTDNSMQKFDKARAKIVSITNYLKESRKQISNIERVKKRRNGILLAASLVVTIVLSGLTIWAFNQKNFAATEQQVAEQKRIEAEGAKSQAMQSKDEAEKAKSKAIENELDALKSKKESDRYAKDVMTQKNIAESEKSNANKQMIIANQEKDNAEKQKQRAENSKELAEKATIEAKKTKELSQAQNMALKSHSFKSNKNLMGLLAYNAYYLNKKKGGSLNDPVIYDALRNAYANLDSNKHSLLSINQQEIRALAVSNEAFLAADKYGNVNLWNFNNNSFKTLFKTNYANPINSIYFDEKGEYLLSGHDNKTLCLWALKKAAKDKNNKDSYPHKELIGHTGLIRTVAFSPDEKHLATAGKDSLIIIWNIELDKPIKVKTIKTESSVKALVYYENDSLISAQENGRIDLWDINKADNEYLFKYEEAMPLCLALNKKDKIILVGYSDGSISSFNLKAKLRDRMGLPLHSSAVEFIVFNKDYSLVASASSNKTIQLYNYDSHFGLVNYAKESDPNYTSFFINGSEKKYKGIDSTANSSNKSKGKISIELNSYSDVRSIIFTGDNKLIASCADKSIRIWETSSDILAEKLIPLLKYNNLSEDVWSDIVGDGIPYIRAFSDIINDDEK